jgi:putative spermidine/putrescine transport system substrate-binding protein
VVGRTGLGGGPHRRLLAVAQVSPASAQGSAAEKELLFGGFGGTSPRAMQTYVVRAFEKKFGVHVTYVAGTSTEMLAKVRAQGGQPQIDIIWMTETTHDQASAAGVSEKLDPKIVTNPADLTPSARMPGDAGVGMGMQALAIEYNTKVFQQRGWAAPASWSDLWDPKFKGHVVAYNVRSATQRLRRIHQRAEWRHHHRSRPAWSRIAALVPNVVAFVAFGLQARRVRGIEQRQRIAEALELVRLSQLADRYPHEHRAESAFAGTPRCWPIPIGPPPCG